MKQIEHTVFFKRAGGVSDIEITNVMEQLAAITSRLEGASNFRCGANISPENLHQNYLDGFIIRFDGTAARDAYLNDAEHRAAGSKLVSLIEGGVKGLIVIDLAVQE